VLSNEIVANQTGLDLDSAALLITYLYWPLRYPPVVIPAKVVEEDKIINQRPPTPSRNYSRVGV